jgi:hypothetical protein
MDEFFYWIIFILLWIVIGNQVRERQERETKDMTKKEKDKYYQDIKDKQKRYMKIVWIILGVLSALIFLFIIWALSQ